MGRHAKAIDPHLLFNCGICGQPVDIRLFEPAATKFLTLMYKNQECDKCTFWRDLATHKPENYFVDKGELFTYKYTETEPFTIVYHNYQYIFVFNNELIRANFLQSFGIIPEGLRYLFPRVGMRVNKTMYHRLKKHLGYQCYKKGCYDRYHCFYYNPAKVEPNGPWNKIPENYQPGWENCPLFINKKDIFNE